MTTASSREVPRDQVRLLVIDPTSRRVASGGFAALAGYLEARDLVVVNDAATLPGALAARTAAGDAIELRLVAAPVGGQASAVVLGAGDFRTPTEHRPAPPVIAVGDRLMLVPWPDAPAGAAAAARPVRVVARSPRSARWLELDLGDDAAAWRTIYALGRPVQYAYRPEPMPLWSVQTGYSARPWAAEMPSAGRALTWELLLGLRRRGVAVVAVTHAAGLSSTGDVALDAALPLPERYEIPAATVTAIAAARRRGGRIVAIGTTVVRALEAAAAAGELRAGAGVAELIVTPSSRPRIVDGLVSGVHRPADSHYRILAALVDDATLAAAAAVIDAEGYQHHELGDACLVLPGALPAAQEPATRATGGASASAGTTTPLASTTRLRPAALAW